MNTSATPMRSSGRRPRTSDKAPPAVRTSTGESAAATLEATMGRLNNVAYHTYKQVMGYSRHRYERKWSTVPDGKGGHRKVLRLKQTEDASQSNSLLRACCIVPVVLFSLIFLLGLMDSYLLMPWNMHIIVTPLPNESVFHHQPGEKVPIVHCEYCEECAPCRECYDGISAQYEAKYDRCPGSAGRCSYPFGGLSHCAQKCPVWLALNSSDVACLVPDKEYVMNTYYNSLPVMMNFRDRGLPVIDGDDDWGKSLPMPREGPNLFLPKGYTPKKKWPLLVMLCGRDSCSWLCMHQFGMRSLAHRYGFVFVSPQATQQPPFGTATVSTRFCTPGDMLNDPACEGSDDARFIWSIITQIKEKYSISTINIVGWSNGAAMANTLACYYSPYIHAVVMLNNGNAHRWGVPNHTTYTERGCLPTHSVHMLYTHDPNDLIVSYTNAMFNFEYWGRINQCDVSVCPTFLRSLDILPRLHGTVSFGGDVLAAMGLRPKRYTNEVDEYDFGNCSKGGSSRLWVMQSYGSSTRWLFVGTPTPAGHLNPSAVGGMGHFPSWGQTNDHGENQALGQRIYEHLLSLPPAQGKTPVPEGMHARRLEEEQAYTGEGAAEEEVEEVEMEEVEEAAVGAEADGGMGVEGGEGYEGTLARMRASRSRMLFTAANLSETSTITHCTVWTAYKDNKKFTLYTMLLVVSGALACICVVCTCVCVSLVRHREESKLVREYLVKKRKTAIKSALAASKMKRDQPIMPKSKAPPQKPPPGAYVRRRRGNSAVRPKPIVEEDPSVLEESTRNNHASARALPTPTPPPTNSTPRPPPTDNTPAPTPPPTNNTPAPKPPPTNNTPAPTPPPTNNTPAPKPAPAGTLPAQAAVPTPQPPPAAPSASEPAAAPGVALSQERSVHSMSSSSNVTPYVI